MTANLFFALFKSFLLIGMIFAFFILVLYFIKKTNYSNFQNHNLIKVLLVHHISPKEKLILIDFAGEKILLGSGSGGISKICKVDDEQLKNFQSKTQNIETKKFSFDWLLSKLKTRKFNENNQ